MRSGKEGRICWLHDAFSLVKKSPASEGFQACRRRWRRVVSFGCVGVRLNLGVVRRSSWTGSKEHHGNCIAARSAVGLMHSSRPGSLEKPSHRWIQSQRAVYAKQTEYWAWSCPHSMIPYPCPEVQYRLDAFYVLGWGRWTSFLLALAYSTPSDECRTNNLRYIAGRHLKRDSIEKASM